jgi:hypothetical protein
VEEQDRHHQRTSSRSVTFASQGTDEVTKNVLDLTSVLIREVVRGIKEAAKGPAKFP